MSRATLVPAERMLVKKAVGCVHTFTSCYYALSNFMALFPSTSAAGHMLRYTVCNNAAPCCNQAPAFGKVEKGCRDAGLDGTLDHSWTQHTC